jgi:hypothetical protein
MARKKAAADEAEATEPKTYKIGEEINGFVVTEAGLPNSCSVTGQPISEGYWFAQNIDEARSGLGISQAAFENSPAG